MKSIAVEDAADTAIDTAAVAASSPNAHNSTDWCIRNWRHISKTRLKNLVADQPAEVQDAFGALSATVSTHASIAWPHQTETRPFTVTGRSTAPQLHQPSMVWLRLRALFGLGDRAEIMRYFLTTDAAPQASVAAIATAIQYTRRNVADECDALADAGMLAVRTVRNRFVYTLAKRTELESLVAPLPPTRPNFATILDVARKMIQLERQVESSAVRTLPVKARKALDRIELDLEELGIEPPTATGSDLWPAMQKLGTDSLGDWSIGRWHPPIPRLLVRPPTGEADSGAVGSSESRYRPTR